MSRARQILFAVGIAVCLAAAFAVAGVAQASAQPKAPSPAVVSAPITTAMLTKAAAASSDCADGIGLSSATREFWRCTGTSATSTYVGSSCTPNEYNAKTEYNMYAAINDCLTRVWVHQYMYPKDTTAGWTICFGPPGNASSIQTLKTADVHPQNIMVSNNPLSC